VPFHYLLAAASPPTATITVLTASLRRQPTVQDGFGEVAIAKLRVFIADDHAVVREGLKALINSQPGIMVIGEAADGLSACEQVPNLQPDVVVMDLSMPGLTGSQATERLKKECPLVKVLALTAHEDKGYLRQILTAGAVGYLLKRSAPVELIRAIQAVASGGVYIDPSLAHVVTGEFVQQPVLGRAEAARSLSEHEAGTLRLTAAGYGQIEIATQLGLSVGTVVACRARAMGKLGLKTRVELVRYAIQQGWLKDG